MKKISLFLSISLILLSGLGCNFIASQFAPPTKRASSATARTTQNQPGNTNATATPRLEPTSAPATEAPAATSAASNPGMPQIVFISCKSQNSLGMGADCGIYIMNEDGSGMRQVTNVSDDTAPSLSPDGARIAFTSVSRDRNSEIYIVNTDGSQVKRLTTNPGEDIGPSWSPDGNQILYMSGSSASSNQLFISAMGADGNNPHTLTKSPGTNPRWSPDGSQILFVTGKNNVNRLNLMDADGTHAQVINTKPAQDNEYVAWSPDGSQIAFISQKTLIDEPEIDIIDKDGSNQHSLTSGYHVIFAGLSWSPDGQKLMFSMRGDGTSLKGNPQLYVVNADGSGLHKFNAPCTYCYGADWGQ